MEPALPLWNQSGDIQITDAYSTDTGLARYDLQVLEDDKQLFTLSKNATNEALLKKHPELETVLNKLAGKVPRKPDGQLFTKSVLKASQQNK